MPVDLHRDGRRSVSAEEAAQEGETMADAGTHDDPSGVDGDSPGPPEVLGEGVAEYAEAARIAVPQ
jgi:hypothetical protein